MQALLQCHTSEHGWKYGMFYGYIFPDEVQSARQKIREVAQMQVRREIIVLDQSQLMFLCKYSGLFHGDNAGDMPAVHVCTQPVNFRGGK